MSPSFCGSYDRLGQHLANPPLLHSLVALIACSPGFVPTHSLPKNDIYHSLGYIKQQIPEFVEE